LDVSSSLPFPPSKHAPVGQAALFPDLHEQTDISRCVHCWFFGRFVKPAKCEASGSIFRCSFLRAEFLIDVVGEYVPHGVCLLPILGCTAAFYHQLHEECLIS